MKIIEVLETFHTDGMSVDTICDIWVPRARKKHSELIGLAGYACAFDDAEVEGIAVERARLRIAVGRAVRKIRAFRTMRGV